MALSTLLSNFWLPRLSDRLDTAKVPVHLGLILDGNRRFAKKIGVSRKEGHSMGIKKFREVLIWAKEFGIKYVTIWVFSAENWERDAEEIEDITDLFLKESADQLDSGEFVEQGIRFRAIGDYTKFPIKLKKQLTKLEEVTKHGTRMILNVSIGYGGRQEILRSVNDWIKHHPGQPITEEGVTAGSYLDGQPTPDLIIRTSGEQRHSGFLLWHSPYAEYYFSKVFWPVMQKIDFVTALVDYQNRKRRYGR